MLVPTAGFRNVVPNVSLDRHLELRGLSAAPDRDILCAPASSLRGCDELGGASDHFVGDDRQIQYCALCTVQRRDASERLSMMMNLRRGHLARGLTLGVIPLIVCGCVRTGGRGHGSGVSASPSPEDTTLLTLVIRTALREIPGARWRVDPRLLPADPPVTWAPSASGIRWPTSNDTVAPLSDANSERSLTLRTQAIEALGLRVGTITDHPQCEGSLIRGPIPASRDTVPDPRCPGEEYTTIVFALPRPVRTASVLGGADGSLDGAHTRWFVRFIRRSLGPLGSDALIGDIEMERDGAKRWRVVRYIPLIVIE